jgi:hypothetical protein
MVRARSSLLSFRISSLVLTALVQLISRAQLPRSWFALLLLLNLLSFTMAEAHPVPQEPVLVSQERELLSSHDFHATFTGIQLQPCRHMTSLCPDRCNHGGSWAVFAVTSYIAYSKPGQYGDEQQTVYHVKFDEKMPADIAATIRTLAPGDAVHVKYDHEYVTNTWSGGGQGKFPERPVRLVERV